MKPRAEPSTLPPPLRRRVTIAVAQLEFDTGKFEVGTLSGEAWDEESYLEGFAGQTGSPDVASAERRRREREPTSLPSHQATAM